MEKQETKTDTHNKAHEVTKPGLEYDSNPFTLSFRGFGLFAQYAKGVVIAIVVFAFINFGFNFISQIIPAIIDTNSSDSSESSTGDNGFNFSFNDIEEDSISTGDEAVTLENPTQDVQNDTDSLETESTSKNLSKDTNIDAGEVLTIAGLVIGVLLVVVLFTAPIVILISAVTKGVIAAGMMSSVAKKEISFGEAFSQMSGRLGALFVAELLSGLRILGGYILFIIPGIRAQLRYESVPYIIMSDPDISAGDALKKAKELYNKHLMEIFGIKFVGSIIPVIGSAIAAGGVGMSLAQLQTYKQAQLATPKTHWINYLILYLIVGSIILLILGIGVIFLALAASEY